MSPVASAADPLIAVQAGDYFTDETKLYRVVSANDERVWVEDCRTGSTLRRKLTWVARLRKVTPSA